MNVLNEYDAPGVVARSGAHAAPAGRPRIKKLSPELRKPKPSYRLASPWYKRWLLRFKEDSQFQRSVVQYAFALLCVWIGVEFSMFMDWGSSGGQETFFPRPPGGEGFLPISALISLKYWLQTGIINTFILPASSFCSRSSASVSSSRRRSAAGFVPSARSANRSGLLGQKLFKRNWTLPRWLDYPLRSLKYLLLLFFGWSIAQMDVGALAGIHLQSVQQGCRHQDVSVLCGDLGHRALVPIGVLMLLSVFVKNFWCRFLCPYGALLGIVGWLSPLKVTRTASSCIDCELCTKACPANIKVHTANARLERRVLELPCVRAGVSGQGHA